MKTLILVAILSLKGLAHAAVIRPSAVPVKNPIAGCDFLNTELDISAILINADGELAAQANPKFQSRGRGNSTYYYHNLRVRESENMVHIAGLIPTEKNVVKILLSLPRNATTLTKIAGQDVRCEVL